LKPIGNVHTRCQRYAATWRGDVATSLTSNATRAP
jgi:hypothetical protein